MDGETFHLQYRKLHKKGKDNVIVDAVSQKDEEVTSNATTVVTLDWSSETRVEYAKDLKPYSIIKT